VKGIVAQSAPAAALRAACSVECDVQDKKQPTAADRDALRSGQSAAFAEDKPYVAFVAAISRKDTLADQFAATAETIHAAYSDKGANPWRDHDVRRQFVIERLDAAARFRARDDIEDIATPFFASADDAQQAAKWLQLAIRTASALKTALDETKLRDLRTLDAIAAYYAAPGDAAKLKAIAAATDPLAAGSGKPPLQVLLVNARSHAASGSAQQGVAAFARFYDRCRAAMGSQNGPLPQTVDEQVLAPAVALIETARRADSASVAGETARAAARLFAARGRFAHLYPAVQTRIRDELAAAGAKKTVARAAFDWFDAAIALDPRPAEYYFGRGYSCDLRSDLSYAQRAKQMEEDANRALEDSRQPKNFPAAHGLRGLSLLYASLSIGDFAKRRELLAKADAAYRQAISECDALRGKSAAADYPHLDDDYPLFLVGRGAVLVQYANYVSDPAVQEKSLATALRLALQVTRDSTDSPEPEPSGLKGIHPEWAYQLAGNAIEDYGWLLKRPEYYPLAVTQFFKAEAAANSYGNTAGANLSRFKRGRCLYKLATDGYLPAANRVGNAPVAAGGETARAQQASALRTRGERALKDAMSEIDAYLETASPDEAEVAEAHGFLASIRIENVVNGFWKSDEYEAVMKEYASALSAAGAHAYSPLDRLTLLGQQAAAARGFAARAKDRPAESAARFKRAREIAESIIADASADSRTKADAHVLIAETWQLQAATNNQAAEVLAAFDRAVSAAAPNADAIAAARLQRGKYRALAAIKAAQRGPAENAALADAAADIFATLEKDEPLSAARLDAALNLAGVLNHLARASNYPNRSAFEAARPNYVAAVRTVCDRVRDQFATRFNRNDRIVFADAVPLLVTEATPLLPQDAAMLKAAGDAAKAAKTASLREFDKWWDRQPTLNKTSAG
jgi:hypothetical protein